jgi:hypothetical protein
MTAWFLAVCFRLKPNISFRLFKDGEGSTIFQVEREQEPNYTR